MIAFIVNLFISLGLVVTGCSYFIKRIIFKKRFRSGISKVISVETEVESDSFVKYPIIKYIANGNEVIAKVDFGMTIFSWKKDDEIRIFYNPEKPKDFIVDEFRVKLLSFVMIIVGFILMVAGFYFYLK